MFWHERDPKGWGARWAPDRPLRISPPLFSQPRSLRLGLGRAAAGGPDALEEPRGLRTVGLGSERMLCFEDKFSRIFRRRKRGPGFPWISPNWNQEPNGSYPATTFGPRSQRATPWEVTVCEQSGVAKLKTVR
jgi:hypothetical protein